MNHRKRAQIEAYNFTRQTAIDRASNLIKVNRANFTSFQDYKRPLANSICLCQCSPTSYLSSSFFTFQDKPPESNVIFYDSNLRKFRIGSNAKRYSDFHFSTISDRKYNNYKYQKSFDNSRNRNATSGQLSKNHREYNNINLNDSNKRDELIRQLKKEKDELLASGKTKENLSKRIEDNNNLNLIKVNENSNLKSYKNNLKQNEQNLNNAPIDEEKEQLIKDNQDNNEQEDENISNENAPKIEVSKKHEEKTIILVPGQTYERKSITEKFENPIEEYFQNEDGTISSVLKQTKIKTITESAPINPDQSRPSEDGKDLSIIKQNISYEYTTISSLRNKNKIGDLSSIQNAQGLNSSANQCICPIGKRYGMGNDKQINLVDDNNENSNNVEQNKKPNINNFGKNKNNYLNENQSPINQYDEEGLVNNNNIKKDNNLNPQNQKGKGKKTTEKDEKEGIMEGDQILGRYKKDKNLNGKIKGLNQNGQESQQEFENYSELPLKMNKRDKDGLLNNLSDIQKGEGNYHDNNQLNKLNQKRYLIKNESNPLSGGGFKNEMDIDIRGVAINSHSSFNQMNNKIYLQKSLKGINQLDFDGLSFDLSKYSHGQREKNPFEGPSPYDKYYRERRIKIKKKIIL